MEAGNKIIHLTLKNTEKGTKKNHYFGSYSAIFCIFTEQELKVKLSTLWQHDFNTPFENSVCTISKEYMIRKKTRRGKAIEA